MEFSLQRGLTSETKRSGHGELLPRHESKIGRPKFRVASNVRVTTPLQACEKRDQISARLKRRGCLYQEDGDWWKCPH